MERINTSLKKKQGKQEEQEEELEKLKEKDKGKKKQDKGEVDDEDISDVSKKKEAVVESKPSKEAEKSAGPEAEMKKKVDSSEEVSKKPEHKLQNPIAVLSPSVKNIQRHTLADGTILIAKSSAKFKSTKPREITLVSGEFYLIVAKSTTKPKMPFIVHTPDGSLTATGTRFSVSTNHNLQKQTLAAVAQGRVVVKTDAGNIQLGAGQQGLFKKGAVPTRSPAPRLSHLVNWAKDGLKQEELLVKQADKENGLIAVDPWGQPARLSLRQYNVDVYIEDGVARTTIDQTFFNHNGWNTEGTFYFPLPRDASVSRLAMYVAGKLNEGGMVTRQRGQEIYTEILYQRRDPALLEMMEGNMFKMRIFPLEGRQEKRILLSYTQTLDELYGASKYWFPMEHTNDVAKQLSITVRVKDGAQKWSPRSSTHEVAVSTDGNDLVMKYAAKELKPDQDFLLNLLPAESLDNQIENGSAATSESVAASKNRSARKNETEIAVCKKDGKQYFVAKIRPEIVGAVDPEPRQWIVLNDVSASRSEIELKSQRYILQRLIEEADDDDSVFLIDLNTKATHVSSEPLNVRSAAAQLLSKHYPKELIGATNIEAGLKAVGNVIAKHKMTNPHLLYLGDGVATDGEKDISQLPFLVPKSTTFVGIGIGKKIDSLFLQDTADRTGGMFTTINPNEDINWRVFDLVSALNTPRMTDVEILLFDKDKKRVPAIVYPSSRGLAAGEVLTVIGRCDDMLPTEIVFRGTVGGKTVAQSRPVKDAKPNATYLPRLWAKLHIDQLLKSDMPRQEEITKLSTEYYVVTPYTSLIVLESDAMYAEYDVERGRKDHWAQYAAPEEIKVVREPFSDAERQRHRGWEDWGYWGRGADELIDAATRPKTVQELVDSIQLRIDAPYYYMHPESSQIASRNQLYRFCDQEQSAKSNFAKSLTLQFLIASGEKQAAKNWHANFGTIREGGSRNNSLNQSRSRRSLFFESNFNGFDLPPAPPLFFDVGILAGGGETKDARTLFFENGLSTAGLRLFFDNRRTDKTPLQSGKKSRRLLQFQQLVQQSPWSQIADQPELARAFHSAINQRWQRVNNDIHKSHGYRQGRFGNVTGTGLGINWLGGAGYGKHKRLDLSNTQFLIDALPAAGNDKNVLQNALLFVSRTQNPNRPVAAQPGTVSVLAAQFLAQRQIELSNKERNKVEQAEFDAIKLALQRTERAGTRIERNDDFWGYNTWNYRPETRTIYSPTIQIWDRNWSSDLTRHAAGLQNNFFDIFDEVQTQFGRQAPLGKIDPEAKRLIEQSRSQFTPVAIRLSGNDKSNLLVGPNDTFQTTRRNTMHLKERMICDGKTIVHFYGELGIAARRRASELRLNQLRKLAPHYLSSAQSLAKRYDIELLKNNAKQFTLKLTAAAGEKEATDTYSNYLLLTVDMAGRILKNQLILDGKLATTLSIDYTTEHQVVMQWTDQDAKELGTFEYQAQPFTPIAELFAIKTGGFVTFDMPLKKPSFYQKKREELLGRTDEEAAKEAEASLTRPVKTVIHSAEVIQLLRHETLASLQELHGRQWGGYSQTGRQAVAKLFAKYEALSQKPAKGDLILFTAARGVSDQKIKEAFSAYPELNDFINGKYKYDHNYSEKKRDNRSLISHIAYANHAISNVKEFKTFKNGFPDSPLLLAVAASNYGNPTQPVLDLCKDDRWASLALLVTADRHNSQRKFTDDQRKDFADAFWLHHKKMEEHGSMIPMLTPAMITLLESVDREKLKRFLVKQHEKIQEQESTALLLVYAEYLVAWGKHKHAEQAYTSARKQLGVDDKSASLMDRFAFAQSLWTGNRYPEAFKQYQIILAELEEKKIALTPGMLGAVARLAKAAGKPELAVSFEERALAAELPHLPEMIDLNAFRQRYRWLWQQYESSIKQISATDAPGQKAKMNDLLKRAKTTWQQWQQVDSDNSAIYSQMATLLKLAGRESDSWMYVSSIIDQKPRDAASYHSVGQWYESQADMKSAERWYREAPQWDTANPSWIFHHAEALKKLGRIKEANAEFQKVINGKWAPGLQRWIDRAKQEKQ